jgi:hypothetical protein
MYGLNEQWKRVARNIGCDLVIVYIVQRKCGKSSRDAYRYAKNYQQAQSDYCAW